MEKDDLEGWHIRVGAPKFGHRRVDGCGPGAVFAQPSMGKTVGLHFIQV